MRPSAGARTLAVLAAACSPTAFAQVALRGGGFTHAPVVEVSSGGVAVGGQRPVILGWDRVREVGGEFAEQAAEFRDLADAAWRARTRLERGDHAMAEPLFESIAARNPGGPTGLLAAEGLMRCRLARGASILAVEPWLEAVRLRREGATLEPGAGPEGSAWIDPETLLSPALAPLWVEQPGLDALAAALRGGTGDPVVDALTGLYRAAALAQQGSALDVPTIPLAAAETRAVSLVRAMVVAQFGDAAQRATARESLRAGLAADAGEWGDAWRRAAIGRGLLREDRADLRRQGMLELLHLPARFAGSQPDLAAVALAEVSVALAAEGDAQGSRALADELRAARPAHPATVWLGRALGAGANPPAPGGAR